MSKEQLPHPKKREETPEKAQKLLETKEQNKELINVIFEGFRKAFEGTELAGFFDMIFADVLDAKEDQEDTSEIDSMLRDGTFRERIATTPIGKLFLQNQRKPGFFAMTFLTAPDGKKSLPSFQVGETYTCSFEGNKEAADKIGLTDIITDNEVGVLRITSGGQEVYGRRIIEEGRVYYAKCDKDGNTPYGPAQYLSLREGDQITITQRLPVSKQSLEHAQLFYKKRATEFLDARNQAEMRANTPGLPEYKGIQGNAESTRSLAIAQKEWASIRATDPRWGVACYRIANRLLGKIRGVTVSRATLKFDYGKDGTWPKLPGTHAEGLARSRQVPIGTVFHMSNSKDYRSLRGSNHWFTLTGYAENGTPLFADQGGHAIPINKIARPGRPLLAVYY